MNDKINELLSLMLSIEKRVEYLEKQEKILKQRTIDLFSFISQSSRSFNKLLDKLS